MARPQRPAGGRPRWLLYAITALISALLYFLSPQQPAHPAPGLGAVASRLSVLNLLPGGLHRPAQARPGDRGALQVSPGGQEGERALRSEAGGGSGRDVAAPPRPPLVLVYRGVYQGLCNQMYALLSMLTVAGELRAGLVLPPSRSRATFEQRRGWADAPAARLLDLPRMREHWRSVRGVQLYEVGVLPSTFYKRAAAGLKPQRWLLLQRLHPAPCPPPSEARLRARRTHSCAGLLGQLYWGRTGWLPAAGGSVLQGPAAGKHHAAAGRPAGSSGGGAAARRSCARLLRAALQPVVPGCTRGQVRA